MMIQFTQDYNGRKLTQGSKMLLRKDTERENKKGIYGVSNFDNFEILSLLIGHFRN
ncbi:hypothetical protein DSM107003_07850 [Trichormus variabilis SAG 1403-4b]|uniref:Uncharacterized protein n=1 Tax=Trichormus variabilis SAG 1403-4b TaxID=447716 RepID=A0A433UY73_ANAVA|nr:hypothetical protein DSM107003_07850 [Trichormus variabilis SAG 1403-4b]